MNIKCNDFDEFGKDIKQNSKRIIIFGAGAIGQVVAPEILKGLDLIDFIDCYIDNNQTIWGEKIYACGRYFMVRSPQYLKECLSGTVILLNISRFSDVIEQLEDMECTKSMDCYIMPMMLIHNYCSSISHGAPVLLESPLIPKKIHYMWLGRNILPDSLKKCIDSWKKYCPDYEIIEWNEDNYDIKKHPYMKQAYDAGAYGFVPDYARLDILYNEGGLYFDTDVELKRCIDKLLYQKAFCGVEKWQVINFGGLSGAVQGNPMIKKFLDARENVFFLDSTGKQNRNTCGFYDTKVAIDAGYRIDGTTQNVGGMNIYAYDYFQPFDYMSGIVNETKHTFSVHWFNGGWLNEKMINANEETRKNYHDLYNRAINASYEKVLEPGEISQ